MDTKKALDRAIAHLNRVQFDAFTRAYHAAEVVRQGRPCWDAKGILAGHTMRRNEVAFWRATDAQRAFWRAFMRVA